MEPAASATDPASAKDAGDFLRQNAGHHNSFLQLTLAVSMSSKTDDTGTSVASARKPPSHQRQKVPNAPATAPHAASTSGPEGTTGRQKDANRGGPPQQPATRRPVAPPGSCDAGNQEGLEEALREAAAHPASGFGAKESPEEARGAQARHLGERRRRASGRPRAHEGVPGPRQKLV
jgi:hypothetical protein